MKLICIGDSLTFGNVGYSYIHFLNKKNHAVNKGKNGDTLRGAYGRLKKIIDKSRHGGRYIHPRDRYKRYSAAVFKIPFFVLVFDNESALQNKTVHRKRRYL